MKKKSTKILHLIPTQSVQDQILRNALKQSSEPQKMEEGRKSSKKHRRSQSDTTKTIKFHSKAKPQSDEAYLSTFQVIQGGVVIDDVPYVPLLKWSKITTVQCNVFSYWHIVSLLTDLLAGKPHQ